MTFTIIRISHQLGYIADRAGTGGTTTSGTARGGDASTTRFKRAITNVDGTSNAAGNGGGTTSGNAQGGTGARTGDGGNAYSGRTGTANGGNVDNGVISDPFPNDGDDGPDGPPGPGGFPGGPSGGNPPPGGNGPSGGPPGPRM